jgi:hypothetical protein
LFRPVKAVLSKWGEMASLKRRKKRVDLAAPALSAGGVTREGAPKPLLSRGVTVGTALCEAGEGGV